MKHLLAWHFRTIDQLDANQYNERRVVYFAKCHGALSRIEMISVSILIRGQLISINGY